MTARGNDINSDRNSVKCRDGDGAKGIDRGISTDDACDSARSDHDKEKDRKM